MTMTAAHPIAIAGATGFVGQTLMQALGPQQPIIGLSRSVPQQSAHPAWQWRSCNLFNLLHTEGALQGAKTAFYLVHSMMPRETLAQGNFADMDLICADNFARAAKKVGVQHIVYLSGIIPEKVKLSLQSRHVSDRSWYTARAPPPSVEPRPAPDSPAEFMPLGARVSRPRAA